MKDQKDQEVVTAKFNRYSLWTVLKVLCACWGITFLMNTGSYSLVAFNEMFSRAIGLGVEIVQYICENCLEALN